MTERIIFVYFENDDNNNYTVYNGKTKKITQEETSPIIGSHDQHPTIIKKGTSHHAYKLGKGYNKDKEGLKNYYNDLIESSKELQKSTKGNSNFSGFDYLFSYTNSLAVIKFFESYCKFRVQKYNLEDITCDEVKDIERPNNGGRIYAKEMDDFEEIYSIDRNSFYQYCMGSPSKKNNFQIPINSGERMKIDKLDLKNLKYGIYHVKITSDHKYKDRLFTFSTSNWYHYYDLLALETIIDYKNNKFKFEYELLNNGEYNCRIYDKTILSSTIFNFWYEKLNKAQYYTQIDEEGNEIKIKNCLVKTLSSRCWGTINSRDYTDKIDYDEWIKHKKDKYANKKVSRMFDLGEKTIVYLTHKDSNNIYKVNNVRVKGFLNSYCRYMMTKHVLNYGVKNVVRMHTDSISFNKKITLDKDDVELFKEEKKTSGCIKFLNKTNWIKKCPVCKKEFHNSKGFDNHECKE